MVTSKSILLCIRSKPLQKKIIESLGESFHLSIQNNPKTVPSQITPRTSFCILDDAMFRHGGKELLIDLREKFPLMGRALLVGKISMDEMRTAVNECHAYALWDKGFLPDEFPQTLSQAIERREAMLSDIMREKDFQQLKSEKENLIDAFNHEVRNAIAPIRISLRTLEREATSEKERKILKRIDKKTLRLSKIMERLLSFQGLEKGKYFFQVMELDISEAINNILASSLFFIQEEERDVTINSTVPDGVRIIFDELMLHLTLEEVLQNAVKYTTDHSSIHISLQEEANCLKIIVEDRGIGLNKEDLDSVWSVGYENMKQENRSSGYYKFRSTGVGLGLSLVRKYLSILGGDCIIESPGRCPAVPICVPSDCPLSDAKESQCEEVLRVPCRYICPGDTTQCDIISQGLGSGWCPGSKVTITLPR